MTRCDEYEFGDDELYEHYVTQSLFLFTSFQYVTMGIIFSSGKPFRMPVYTNVFMMAVVIVLTICNLVFLLLKNDKISDAYEMTYWPENLADNDTEVVVEALPAVYDEEYGSFRPM